MIVLLLESVSSIVGLGLESLPFDMSLQSGTEIRTGWASLGSSVCQVRQGDIYTTEIGRKVTFTNCGLDLICRIMGSV